MPTARRGAEPSASSAGYPPLGFPRRTHKLKKRGKAAAGNSFLLAGRRLRREFNEAFNDNIRDFFRVLEQMAVVMTFAAASPIVKVGRVAGQFAKPRWCEKL